eukprot:s177_g39.t2
MSRGLSSTGPLRCVEVLGGPLGAIIGGYNEEDWLYQEIFSKDPGQALEEAFQLLGFPSDIGDWSGYMVEEISLAYRRQCLRGHPSRGGSARNYLKLQVAMELIRAFDQELALEADASPEAEPEAAWSPMTRRKRKVHGFVLDDLALVRELELSQTEAAMEADTLPAERLEELNRALDEYILRQMCFKSEIVAEIARLHENSAYSILGVSPEASDAEIKKAYRLVAMQCHPDKGGDKAEFQELHEAYEKIMEQRRSSANLAKSGGGSSIAINTKTSPWIVPNLQMVEETCPSWKAPSPLGVFDWRDALRHWRLSIQLWRLVARERMATVVTYGSAMGAVVARRGHQPFGSADRVLRNVVMFNTAITLCRWALALLVTHSMRHWLGMIGMEGTQVCSDGSMAKLADDQD